MQDHPGKCYLTDFGPIEPGKTAYNNKDCSRITCDKDTYDGSIETCPLKGLNPSICKPLPQDYSKNYPECCLKYECKGEDGQVTIVWLFVLFNKWLYALFKS